MGKNGKEMQGINKIQDGGYFWRSFGGEGMEIGKST